MHTALFWKYFDVVSFVAKSLYNSFTKLSLFVRLEENVATSTMLSFDLLSFVSEIGDINSLRSIFNTFSILSFINLIG